MERGGASKYNICNGCKTAIGDSYVNALGVLWHPQCLLCLHCYKPIANDEISNLKCKSHKLCYKKHHGLPCYVCRNKLPSTKGRVQFTKHSFWDEMYCPHHEYDGTVKCCSCERLQAYGTEYAMLPNRRWICIDCKKTSVINDNEGSLSQEIRGFFERLDMKVEQKFPIRLVPEQEMKKDNEDGTITKGICLSKGCTVIEILILYGLPRLLAGCILAHEMMHAYCITNGYKKLNKTLEEGICQVVGHMWLKSQRSSSSASSSRTTTSRKHDQSGFEKKLLEFGIDQIETDETPHYGDGFRIVYQVMVSNNYNIKDTLREIHQRWG